MDKIRIYFIPKGYKDIVCDLIILNGKEHTAQVCGGKEDNTIYTNCRGAKVIKFEVDEDEEL